MTPTGYFIDSLRGQSWYRCLSCQYDSFSLDSIKTHTTHQCPAKPLPEAEIPLEQWRSSTKGLLSGVKICVSMLTWNTDEASKYSAMALVREKRLLEDLGTQIKLVWADNGSSDATKPLLSGVFGSNLDAKLDFSRNMGQSAARNYLREQFLKSDCDFWVMVDGDIEVIPYSVFALTRAIKELPDNIGNLGMYSRNCSHVRDESISTDCRKIEPWMLKADPTIAWTNYGVFRRSAIECATFEESGPFGGPGWGLEDDDFELQLRERGYSCISTAYFRHMHRRRHSSIKNLPNLDAKFTFEARKRFLQSKWTNVSPYATYRMSVLANQHMPVLDY